MKPCVAKRLRIGANEDSDGGSMETVVCDKCGQRFAFPSDPGGHSTGLTGKQAAWVADQLVWDHIQERKHPATMILPSS